MKRTPFILATLLFVSTFGQAQTGKNNDTLAINTMYQDWSKAMATNGAEGYASFFILKAVLLPPDSKAISGRDSIQKWMKTNMDSYTFQPTGFSNDEMRIEKGWAFLRVTISGTRTPKTGGQPTSATNKYLDVLQKQSDGKWMFVYRMWNTVQ